MQIAKVRVFICVKGNCADSDLGWALEEYLNNLIEEYGLDDSEHPRHTTCQITNCLGVCKRGPIIIIHPGAIRYSKVNKTNLTQIFQTHILQGLPVQDLILEYPFTK